SSLCRFLFFFSSRRRHTRSKRDWSSDVCSSDLSSKPGKTRTLNYYTMNESFYFVDVPGYGYAKVSKQERAKWAEMMQEYFEKRDKLNAVVLIIDGRHTPTNDDLQMVEYIQYLQVPLIVICTKMDKLTKNKRTKALKAIEAHFPQRDFPLIPFSAITGENKEKAWEAIIPHLK